MSKQKTDAHEPPPEVFRRTPEQVAAERAELEAQVARMKAGLPVEREMASQEMLSEFARIRAEVGARSAPPAAVEPVGLVPLDLERWRARSLAWQADRRALVCWQALYPKGAPDGFLDQVLDHAQCVKARTACRAAGARDGCRYAHETPTCLWERADAIRELARARLTQKAVGEEEARLILASTDPDQPVPLKPYDPLVVVRRWLEAARVAVPVRNAVEIAPLTGELREPGKVHLAGDERLLIFGGNPGRGKTVAGLYALAREGGLYVLEYAVSRAFDVDAAASEPGVVVIDQVQPLEPAKERRAALRLDEIVHRRFAAGRKTLLIGNIDHTTFARRFGQVEGDIIRHPGVICERCAQAGLFVLFGGTSVRGGT